MKRKGTRVCPPRDHSAAGKRRKAQEKQGTHGLWHPEPLFNSVAELAFTHSSPDG